MMMKIEPMPSMENKNKEPMQSTEKKDKMMKIEAMQSM